MFERITTGAALVGLLLVATVGTAAAQPATSGQRDLAEVRAAVAAYHHLESAQDAGWALVPGLDHCFDNPGTGAMGYHYIDAASLDLTLDPLRPRRSSTSPAPRGSSGWERSSTSCPRHRGTSSTTTADGARDGTST
jgi:hypothetical protein